MSTEKLEEYKKKPLVLTKEDVDHLSPLDQVAARVLKRRGYLKVVEEASS